MKNKLFLSLLLSLFVSLTFAQAPAKFTYQAVVRDATNHLVVNSPVGMRISILQGGVNGTMLYVETHNAVTNSNGLITVVIGSGNLLQGSITAIDWREGPMFLQTEIDPTGGTNYTITSTQQLLSVPYALYAGEAANGFSGDYNDLSNLPQIPQIPANVSYFTNDAGYITMDSIPPIPTVPTNVSAFTNDAGYITGYTESDPQFNAWDKNYNDLTNKPVLFDGDYNSLTNQPQIPTVPTNVSAFVNDVPYLTTFTEQQVLSISHDTLFLTGGSFVKLPESFDGDYNSLTNKPTIPSVPTNVSAFTNDAGYITGYTETDPLFSAWDKNYNDLTNKPTLFSGNYNDLTNKPSLFSGNYNDLSNKPVLFDWDYYSLNNRPTIPTVPTNVSAFTNDAGYITDYTETDPLFSAWDKNYNDLTNKPTLFDGNYNSLSNKPSLFSGDYNDLTNKPVIPTVPTNVSAFTNDVPYLTAEQQILSIRHDTIFLTGGSFVKLPESLTEDQVSQMIHQCCSSMQLYVDSVVTTRVNNLLSQQLTDAFKHYLDSLAEAMAQTYIDSVNVPCPIVSHDSVFPANPCPEAPYVLDWDGNVYNTVKIGSQCWMQENLRSWHFSDGTIIPSTTISYYYNEGPYGPNRIKPDNNIDNVATYGYLYNYEAVFRTNDTSILNNSIPSGVQGICPNGWHIPSMAEWQQLVDYMGNYSMYICDDQTYNVAKALAAQTGWRDDCSNLCAIGTDLSANNASGFSALPAGEAWGNDPHYFGDRAYFWSATQSTHNLNEAKIFKMDYPQANCDLDYYCGLTGAMSVRCLRDPGAPTPPCPPVSVTISGETQICSGSSTTLTAAGAQTYVWSNGQSDSNITVNSTGTYSVTGTDANGCKGTASVNVTAHVPKHESLNVTTCSSYTWHGQIYTSGGTYTYAHTDNHGCTQVDTLRLTMDDCATVVTGNISYVTPTSAVVSGNATSYDGTSIIARGICWGQTSYPTILSDNYTNDGTGNGSFYGVLTGLAPNTNYHVRAYATTSSGTSYGEVITFYTTSIPSSDAIPCPGHETVTDYDGNTYNTVKIGQQCWMKENLKTQHYADGTLIPIGMVASTTNAYRYHPNNNSDNLDMYGYLYNWPAVMHGETSSSNNPSGVQGICPMGWHVPSDAEWNQLTDYLMSIPAYGRIGNNEVIAKALSAKEGWPVSDNYGAPGHYPILNNLSGFSAKPAGYYNGNYNNYHNTQQKAYFWSATESVNFAWNFFIRFEYDQVFRDGDRKDYGLSVRCVLGSGSTPTATTPTVSSGAVSNITSSTATVSGNVTADGGATVTARGVCWSTSHNPTVSGNHTADGTGTGSFTSTLTGLTPNTTYYVRAYATNAQGTSYGNELSFTTVCSSMSVTISGNTSICAGSSTTLTAVGAQTYAWSNGQSGSSITVNSAGTYAVTGTNANGCSGSASVSVSVNPSTEHTETVTACGSYTWVRPDGSSQILYQSGTYTYPYVNAYGCSSMETLILALTPCATTPAVHISDMTNVTTTSAVVNAEVASDGGATVTSRGICWGLSPLPTIDGPHTTEGGGVGTFSSTLTGLTPGTTYFVQAYAINSVGIAYSNSTEWFTTLCAAPTDLAVSNITMNSATISWGSGSGTTDQELQFKRQTDIEWLSLAVFDNTFTLTNLEPGTVYEVRVREFCANGEYTDWSNTLTFTTVNCPALSITISGNTSICEGSSTTLTAAGAQTYAWSNGQSGSIITVNSAGTYAVTGTDANGCTGTVIVTVDLQQGTFTSEMEIFSGNFLWHRSDNTDTVILESGTYIYHYLNANGCSSSDTLVLEINNSGEYVSDGQPCPGIPTVTDIDHNVYNTVKIGNQCWMKENIRTTRYTDGTVIPISSALSETVAYRYAPNGNSGNVEEYGYLYNWPAAMHGEASSTSVPSGVQGICPTGWHLPSDLEWTQLEDYLGGNEEYRCGGIPLSIAKALSFQTGWLSTQYTFTDECNVGNMPENNNASGFSARPAGYYNASLNMSTHQFSNYNYHEFGEATFLWSATTHQNNYPGTRSVHSDQEQFLTSTNFSKYQAYSVRCLHDEVVQNGDTTHIDTSFLIPSSAQPCPGAPTVADHEGNVYHTLLIGNQCWTRENMRCSTSPNGYLSESESNSLSNYEAFYYDYVTSAVPLIQRGYLYNWAGAMDTTSTDVIDVSFERRRGICPEGWHIPSDLEWFELEQYVLSGMDTFSTSNPGTLYRGFGASRLAGGSFWFESGVEGAPGNAGSDNNTTGFSAVPAGERGNHFLRSRSRVAFWSSTSTSGYNAYYRAIDFDQSGVYRHNSASKNWGLSVRCLRDDNSGGSSTQTTTTANSCTIPTTHPAQTGSTYQGNGFNGANYGLETISNGLITSVTDYDGNEYPLVQIGSQCWLAENMRCTHSPSTGTYIVNNLFTSGTNVAFTYSGKMARWYNNDSITYVSKHYGLLYNWNAAVDVYNTSYGELSIMPSNYAVNIIFSNNRQGICPIGWHVPSDEDWTIMTDYVSGQSENQCNTNSSYIGKSLASTTDWAPSTETCAVGNNLDENNATGFSAVPTGFYDNLFYFAGNGTYFWSSSGRTGSYSHYAWIRQMQLHSSSMSRYSNSKSLGYSVRCLRDDNSGGSNTQIPPSVTTPSASNITPTSATITSNVTADGGATVTARGICWSTAHNPTINDSHTTDGAGIGTFNSLLSGLTPGTTYFVRAYATNSVGTTYGDEISFTTTVFVDTTSIPSGDAQTCPGTPILTDIDNNVYNTVKIGDQCWMKENLRTTRFADGTSIPYSYDFDETTPYRCPADSNLEYVTTFGYLYNWKAAMRDECLSNTNPSGVQGACPDGWHLPSQAEWHQLIHYVKNQASYTQSSDTNMIAKAMASQFGWVNSSYELAVGNSPEANNQTGFTILPAGFYGIHTDVDSLYNFHFGKYTVLWSSSKKLEDRSHNCVLYVHADSSKIYDNLAGAGHAVYASIRCLRNNSETGNVSAVDIQNIRTILDTNHVTSTSAPVYGMVPSVSNADVDFYGICISTSPNPTVDGIHSTYYTNPILFGTTFTNLATNTTYYVRAYAQSCNSTFYGPEISFTTLPCNDYSTIIVHDTVTMDASLFLLYEDFETDGLPNGWSILDNDGDGHNWNHSGDNSNSSSHSGSGCMFSESYLNNVGPLTPDNYLITPALTIPANTPTTLSWYVMAQDSNWRAEHYEVRLSTSGTNASDFNQLLFENTISSSLFTHHEVDLSSYSGQTVHIAFVHNNCTDMFRLNLDDIFVYTGSQTYPTDYTEIQTGECIRIVKHYVIVRPFSEGVNCSPAPKGNDTTLDGSHQNNFTNQGAKRINSSIPANSSAPEMNINAPHSSGNGAHSDELFSE